MFEISTPVRVWKLPTVLPRTDNLRGTWYDTADIYFSGQTPVWPTSAGDEREVVVTPAA